MSEKDLLVVMPVQVDLPTEDMPGRTLRRVTCNSCGEGINDAREVIVEGRTLCRSCAGGGYYRVLPGVA